MLTSIILTLFFIEIFNYFFILNKDNYYVWPPNFEKEFFPDPEIFSGIYGSSNFTINSLGYRGPVISDKTKEYRVLVVGGSTTECLYLDDEEEWPYLSMKNIFETNGGREVIFINIGKSGHNTRDHIFQLKHLLPVYEPDIVVSMVGVNDMLYLLSKWAIWEPFDEENYDLDRVFYTNSKFEKKSTISYKLFKILSSDVKPQDVVGGNVRELREERRNGRDMKEIPDLEMPLKDYKNNLHRFINISRENGMKVLFITQPYLWNVNNTEEEDSAMWMTTDYFGHYYYVEDMAAAMDKYNQVLLNVCLNNLDVFCLDLEKEVPKSLNYFYDDVHFNEKGAQLASDELSFFMNKNFYELNNLCYNK